MYAPTPLRCAGEEGCGRAVLAQKAAFGVPTLMHNRGIGAQDLLGHGARFCTDMTDVKIAGAALAHIVQQGEAAVTAVGEAAKAASLAWTLPAFRDKLNAILHAAAMGSGVVG